MKTINLIISLIALIFISSCSKERKKDGTFTIKGTALYREDSISPMVNETIEVWVRYYDWVGKRDDLYEKVGIGLTDNNGIFEIVCDYYGPGNQSLVYRMPAFSARSNKDINPDDLPIGKKDTTYDFGTFYGGY